MSNVEQYIEQEKLYNTEGRRGVVNLCKLVSALDYRDPQYFGQLERGACIGDLICFLEDNSGAIQALQEWIIDTAPKTGWEEIVESQLHETEEN